MPITNPSQICRKCRDFHHQTDLHDRTAYRLGICTGCLVVDYHHLIRENRKLLRIIHGKKKLKS